MCCEYGYPIWDNGGHLFRCPHCEYSANADINAAANLAAKFFGLWLDVTLEDGVYMWKEDGDERTFAAREAFEKWAGDVKRRKLLDKTPF